ncbi:MAG: prolipoprotein diacylglyceryl transferase [Deltaproteobacteria bacterium]|nr:prolipoprotein diacylglyceryl transferase [Deltaproteobacteria bacterium]
MVAYVIEWGWLKIGSYGVMMALGFLAAWYLFRLELGRKGLDTDLASRITFNAAIWGVIGARLLSILEEPSHVIDNPLKTILLEGGLTWYGGLAAGAAATIYTIRKAKAPIMQVIDAMSPAALVGYAFGRGGCLISGDGCYGIATDLPWGMQFPKLVETPGFHCMQGGAIASWPPIDPSTCLDPSDLSTCLRYPPDVHVHPTPAYEILAGLLLFALVWSLRKRINRTGLMFGLFLVLQAIPRTLVEFIRLNPRYAGLSLSQWVSIGIFFVGLWLIWYTSRQAPETAPTEVAVEPEPKGRKRRRRK